MAISATVTGVVYETNGQVFINFSDGTQLEFANRDALINHASSLETDAQWAKSALIRAWLHRSEDASNPTWITGRTLQMDLSLDLNPLVTGSAQ